MKKILSILSLVSFATVTSGYGAVVFSENFTEPDGGITERPTTTGTGNLDFAGNGGGAAFSIVSNTLVLNADGNTDRVEFESTAQATTGFFEFDLTINEAAVVTGVTGTSPDRVFVQLVSGDNRATGGMNPNGVGNFSDTLTAGAVGLVSGVTNTVRYYFNTTNSDFVYTDSGGVQQTLNAGGYDFFVGTTLTQQQQSPSAGIGGIPTSIDTLALQTFGSQEGVQIVLDNVSLNAFTVIPEPSTGILLGLASLGFFVRRRS